MLNTRQPATSRRGFSLIELLVVIAILAILMALTTAGVMKIMGKGPELQTRSELSQMASGISEAEAKLQVDYIPSRIVLYDDVSAYNTSVQVELDSLTFLKRIFPRLGEGLPVGGFIDWNGNGVKDGATLSGDQCLVFFLGGIPHPTQNTCQGFSDSNRNPAQPGGNRRGPYFNFKSDRLIRGANGFFSYQDPYRKQVYAFFSCYGKQNGYNRYSGTDCNGILPYKTGATTYTNPTSFQIISAGADGVFGPGGTALPATGAGVDDMSNFHSTKLGSP